MIDTFSDYFVSKKLVFLHIGLALGRVNVGFFLKSIEAELRSCFSFFFLFRRKQNTIINC